MAETDLNKYFRSILEQDRAQIVVCSLDHKIIYMNPEAKARYAKRGGEKLLGQSLKDCHNSESCEMIDRVVAWFAKSKDNNIVYTFHNEKYNKDVYMVALRDENGELIGYYEKHEFRSPETMKRYDMD